MFGRRRQPQDRRSRLGRRQPRPQLGCEALEARRLLAQTGWWSFDEGTGTTARDGSETAAALTLSGAPVWQTSGRVGGAVSFANSTSQYATGAATVGGSATLSFSAWLRPSSLPASTFIPLDKTPVGSSGLGWRLELGSDGSITFRIGSSTSFARVTSATAAYAANAWVQVAGTYAAGTATLYVNGAQAARATGLTVGTGDTTASFRIGMPSVFSVGTGSAGSVDDVKLFDTVLSPTAIARQYAVDTLPEGTVAERLKKATLGWAVEDAIRDEDAGFASSATSTYADVQTLVTAAIGTPRTSPAAWFPAIPSYATNPIVTAAITQLTTLRSSTYRPPKAPASYSTNLSVGDVFGRWSDDGLQGAFALGQTQNAFYADPKLLWVVLRRFQGCFEGTPNTLGDFFNAPDIEEMYALFKGVFPDLILPSKQAAWESVLERDAAKVYADQSARLLAGDPTNSYFNADVGYVTALRWNAELFPTRTAYRTAADAGIALLSSVMYPDGGTPYISTQNECFTYHGIGVNAMARYWQAFGDTRARDLVLRSTWYYPLSIEPRMTTEYSTAPSWKHYWNAVTGADSAYLVASMARSPENMTVFRNITNGSFTALGNAATLTLATYYTTDVVAGASPDSYVTYDRNLLGARARFGNWSFSSTANPVAGDNRGKATFVGAMLLDPPGSSPAWSLNAGVDSVGTRLRLNAAGTTIADSTQNEFNALTVTDRFAAVTSVNNPAPYKQAAQTGWQGTQEWLQTANRMVGLVSMKALTRQSTFAVQGAIELVSGRGTWGTQKTFTQLGPGIYQYGNLIVTIVATDYAATSTSLVDTWGADGAKKSGLITLSDASSVATGGTTSSSYAAGFSQYYLVDIRPVTTAATSSIARLQPGNGLQGFAVTDGGRRYQVIDNPTAAPLTYTTTLAWADGVVIHPSGERYRPGWLGTSQSADTDFRGRPAVTQPYAVAAGAVTVTVPPRSHVVLESNTPGTIIDRVIDVPAGTTVTAPTDLSGPTRLVKRGAGTLVVSAAASHSGGTVVEAGELVVRQEQALGSAGLVIGDAARVRLDLGRSGIALAALSIAAAGRLDVGTGRIDVAASGYDAAAIRNRLFTGCNDGGWNAASGIVSSAAGAAVNRAVGMVVGDGGGMTIAWAAPGDTNLDGMIDLIDIGDLLAASSFDAGAASGWAGGDFNYDGVMDVIDVLALLASDLFDRGPYGT